MAEVYHLDFTVVVLVGPDGSHQQFLVFLFLPPDLHAWVDEVAQGLELYRFDIECFVKV